MKSLTELSTATQIWCIEKSFCGPLLDAGCNINVDLSIPHICIIPDNIGPQGLGF